MVVDNVIVIVTTNNSVTIIVVVDLAAVDPCDVTRRRDR